jgi:hypothetical protein
VSGAKGDGWIKGLNPLEEVTSHNVFDVEEVIAHIQEADATLFEQPGPSLSPALGRLRPEQPLARKDRAGTIP